MPASHSARSGDGRAPTHAGLAVLFTPGVLAGVRPQTRNSRQSEFWSLPASASQLPNLQTLLRACDAGKGGSESAFSNNRRAVSQSHRAQRPILGAGGTRSPQGPSQSHPGWAPCPNGGCPERRPELGFSVDQGRTSPMTPKGRSPAPGF